MAYETFAPLCDPTAVGPVRSDTTTGRVVWPPPWWSLLIGARSFCLELNTTHGSPKKREGGGTLQRQLLQEPKKKYAAQRA